MSGAIRAEQFHDALELCPHFGALIDLEPDQRGDLPGALRTGVDPISFEAVVGDLQDAARPGGLGDVTVPGKPTSSAILQRLRRWGVAMMPGLLPADLVAALEGEFERMMASRAELARTFRVDEEPGSVCMRAPSNRLSGEDYPVTTALFASPVLRALADAYYGDAPYALNHAIFVHRTGENAAPPSGEIHFDVTRMLKFWINLSDATVANGAMRIVPGSHFWLRMVRRDYSERLTPKKLIPNQVEGLEDSAIHLVGPPGTMFIFDTDAAHAASPVLAGGERRIMRGHCTENELIARAKARG